MDKTIKKTFITKWYTLILLMYITIMSDFILISILISSFPNIQPKVKHSCTYILTI